MEFGACDFGVSEVGAAEVGAAEIGVADVGVREDGVAEFGPADGDAVAEELGDAAKRRFCGPRSGCRSCRYKSA